MTGTQISKTTSSTVDKPTASSRKAGRGVGVTKIFSDMTKEERTEFLGALSCVRKNAALFSFTELKKALHKREHPDHDIDGTKFGGAENKRLREQIIADGHVLKEVTKGNWSIEIHGTSQSPETTTVTGPTNTTVPINIYLKKIPKSELRNGPMVYIYLNFGVNGLVSTKIGSSTSGKNRQGEYFSSENTGIGVFVMLQVPLAHGNPEIIEKKIHANLKKMWPTSCTTRSDRFRGESVALSALEKFINHVEVFYEASSEWDINLKDVYDQRLCICVHDYDNAIAFEWTGPKIVETDTPTKKSEELYGLCSKLVHDLGQNP